MKLHPNLVKAVVLALEEIQQSDRHADKVIERVLREDPRRGSRDRRFIAETIYDIVRWKRLYQTATDSLAPSDWLAAWLIEREISLPAWPMFQSIKSERIRSVLSDQRLPRAVRQSIPDWLDERGVQELGASWDVELAALNQPAPVVLRTNRLKATRGQLIDALSQEGVEASPVHGLADAVVLEKRMSVFRTRCFHEGWFEMQDAASQQVAPYLQPEPGMRIIDACAGAGGKTLHLAALMRNKGRLIAMDTSEWKLNELRKRARRAGVTNLETRLIEGSRTIKRLAGSADAVLLDVPCSGSGVWRRNPDSKWKLTPESLDETRSIQSDILDGYSAMARPGGRLVYATCSILPSENRGQVDGFLNRQNGFGLQEDRSLLPSQGTDGFYMARLLRSHT